MKLLTPLTVIINATSNMWRIHDFNYKLPKEAKQNFWEKECIENPTSVPCKASYSQYKFKILKRPF